MMQFLALLGCLLAIVWIAESALFVWSYWREIRRRPKSGERKRQRRAA